MFVGDFIAASFTIYVDALLLLASLFVGVLK
jgi:hypothetical protein